MRNILIGLSALILISNHTFAANSLKHITISISGMGNPPNYVDLNRVRKTLAGFVEDLKIKEYKLVAVGTDGGFFACILPWSKSDSNLLWSTINSLPFDSKATIFKAEISEDCE